MAKGNVKWGTGAGLALGLVLLWGPGGCGGGGPVGSLPPGVSGLYFSADDGTDGREPWVLRSPSLSPVQLKDIHGAGGSSDPQSFVRIKDTVYFTARDGAGRELWRTDGTTAGTERVADIKPGGGDGIADGAELAVYNGDLYFAADDGTTGTELWVYDVSQEQVRQVKDINQVGNSNPGRFTESDGTLFFSATNGNDGVELWRTEGTVNQTVMVQDINPDSGQGSDPRDLVDRNGSLVFRADNGTIGAELWEATATKGSARKIEIRTGSEGSNPKGLTEFNQQVWFSARGDNAQGVELWSFDGSSATRRSDINNGGDSNPHNLKVVGGNSLFFAATNGVDGVELYRLTSVQDTPTQVENLNGAGSSNPRELADFGGTLVFQADDGEIGAEPWHSDGSDVTPIADLNTAQGVGSVPREFTVFEDQIFFTATDDSGGRELWRVASLGFDPVRILINNSGDYDPRELAAL